MCRIVSPLVGPRGGGQLELGEWEWGPWGEYREWLEGCHWVALLGEGCRAPGWQQGASVRTEMLVAGPGRWGAGDMHSRGQS